MNTTDVSRCKYGITSISRNFLDAPEFPRLLGKFPKSQVDSQIPKILGKFPSSGSAGIGFGRRSIHSCRETTPTYKSYIWVSLFTTDIRNT